MRCFECGHLNPAGAQFCNLCGRRMTKQLIVLDGQPPNEAKSGAGDGFHPARFAQYDTNKTENENTRTAMKAERSSETLDIVVARSAFHPARFSAPGISMKSPASNSVSLRDTESSATSNDMLFKKSSNPPASVSSAVGENDYSTRSPWFHFASFHHAEKPNSNTLRATEQEKSVLIKEDEIAKRAWRIPRPFDKRGTNRFYNDTPIEEIMIEPPPKVDGLFRANWKYVFFAPSIVLSLITTLLVMILLSHASSLSFYAVLIGAMFVVGLSGGIAEYLLQTSQWRANQKLKKLQYTEYLEKLEHAWNQRAERQLQMLTLQNPSIEGCIALMKSRSERIWERTEKDDDFLCVRVGRGERAFELGILMSPISYEEREAELHTRMRDLVEAHRYISPAPVLLDLKMQSMIGMLGDPNETSPVIQSFIIQLATFHSPEEVEFVLLGAEKNATDWAKISQLPHVQQIIETTEDEVNAVRSVFEQRSRKLGQHGQDAEKVKNRFVVLFVLEGAELTKSDLETLPLFGNRAYKTCVIIQSASQARLPMHTELILRVANRDGEIYRDQSDEAPQQICLDLISNEQMGRFLSALRVHQS